MLKRSLGKILTLWNSRESLPPLDERARNTPHPQFHGKRRADRATTDDNYLVSIIHNLSLDTSG